MGNRAIVAFANDDDKHGIYLHWNGGPESVLAFLRVMEERKWTRMDYASARFTSVVCEFFDADGASDGLSVGIMEDRECGAADWDNGLYMVHAGGDGFKVYQRINENAEFKPVTYEDLTKPDREKCDGIVDSLASTRETRTPKARMAAGIKAS